MKKEYDEKFTSINESITKAMEQIPSKNLLENQQDLITDLIGSAIDQCEKLCNEVEATVRNKGQNYVNSLTKQLDNEKSRRSKENIKFWDEIKKGMGIVYQRLINTNKTAINNINILNMKLSMAETKIETMTKVVDEHSIKTESITSMISNDNTNIDKLIMNETRTRRLMESLDIIEDRTNKLLAKNNTIEASTNKITDIGIKLTQYEMDTEEITTRLELIDSKMDTIKNKLKPTTVRLADDKDTDNRTTSKNEDEDHNSSQEDHDEPNETMFMNKYAINMDSSSNYPILTPFQYLYPRDNHTPREIDSHKFQKAKMAMT